MLNITDDYSTPPQVDDWRLANFLADPRSKRPDFLVDALAPERSLIMISAEPGAGKTMLAGSLGLAVSEGRPFLDLPTKQSGVLFIGEDAPAWDYGVIFRKLLNGNAAPETFHLAAHEGFQLLDRGWRARLSDYLERTGVGLVILDTLRAVHGNNENDSREMQQVMTVLRAISVTYAVSLIFLHHTTKKNAEGFAGEYRGSSVLLGSCDAFIHMSAEKGLPGSKILTLEVKKGRGTDCGLLTAKLTWDDRSAKLSRAAGVAAVCEPTAADIVLAELSKGPIFVDEVVKLIPARGRKPKTIRGQVDALLHRLEHARQVRWSMDGRRKRWELVSGVQNEAA